MKKKKNLFNKKIIVYLGFFIIFSFLPICKAHAADFLQVVSSTGPTSNEATTSQTLNFFVTFKAPQLTATPDATDTNYDVYFQPYCGTNSASGATYIVSSMSKVTAQNTTFTRSWTLPNGGGCPLGTETFRWELYEVNNAGVKIHPYVDKSFNYGIDTNYQGYYYIYQKPNGTYYLFSVAGRFADQQLCTTDANNFVAQNPDYTIYKACQYYDSIPATNTAEFVNISAIKDTTSTAGTYTLLAPIGGMTTAPTNIGDYFNKIFLIAIGLCGALAVIMIVIGGVQYMGDESIFGKTEAKSHIKNAILGLLIALASYVLLNTINPDLLGKGGVNIQQVSAEIIPLYDRGATDPKQLNGESVRCVPLASGPCSVSNLTTALGVDTATATAMSKICSMESGGTSVASGTDYCSPPGKSQPFSFGLFQVNLAANGSLASTSGLDCSNLFDRKVSSADAIVPKYTSGFTCSLLPSKEILYNTCKNRLLDTAINLAIAKNLLAASPNKSPWIGDKKYCASAFN